MRTTLNLDDDLVRAVKRRAADTRRTMTEVIESALREVLARPETRGEPYRLEMPVVQGTAVPGVDLTDRDQLYEAMERRA